MRSAMQDSQKSVPSTGVDPFELWYAPNPRLRSKAAGEQAVAIAEGVTGVRSPDFNPDEQELFVALHTCAYRAARKPSGRRILMTERTAWARRWEIIRGYIVEQNIGLVYSMIGRLGARQLDEDDRLSEGMYALTRAVDRFNPWRGYKFSTYACNVIARALMRRGKQESNHRRMFPVQHDLSYERPVSSDDEGADLYVERLRRIMRHKLGDVTDLETEILAHRFPADQESRLTFQEIGNTIGLSKERVRQIQNIALTKLREVLDADPVLL